MPKLIIGNNFNEHMVGDSRRVDDVLRRLSTVFSARLAWLLEDGDVLVLPGPLADGMKEYLAELLGLRAETIAVVHPDDGGPPHMLATEQLLAPALVERLRRVVTPSASWTVVPFYPDASVVTLCERLGLAPAPSDAFFAQDGTDLLNSKTAFRRIAAGADLPTPAGAVCSTERELRDAVRRFIGVTGSVMIKQDRNAGGDGNVAITRDVGRPHPGARLVQAHREDPAGADAQAREMWELMIGPMNASVVVEVYEPSRMTVYAEYEVARGGSSRHLSTGALRMESSGDPRNGGGLLFVGFEIPAPLRPAEAAEFHSSAAQYARAARDIGFSGRINIDAIVLPDGRALFTEVNGRLGGCTHIHVAAERLLGRGYANGHVILSRNAVPAGSPASTLAIARRAGLALDRARGEGVVVLVAEPTHTRTVEYMVVARDRERATEIEGELARALAREAAR